MAKKRKQKINIKGFVVGVIITLVIGFFIGNYYTEYLKTQEITENANSSFYVVFSQNNQAFYTFELLEESGNAGYMMSLTDGDYIFIIYEVSKDFHEYYWYTKADYSYSLDAVNVVLAKYYDLEWIKETVGDYAMKSYESLGSIGLV